MFQSLFFKELKTIIEEICHLRKSGKPGVSGLKTELFSGKRFTNYESL